MAKSKSKLHPVLSSANVRAFEKQFEISLPGEYRHFLMKEGNGGAVGPQYGLLPLGLVPDYWAGVHDYSDRLNRTFPLDSEWVWEDEPPEAPDLQNRINQVDDGVLLLGEEGCGARWVLVVTGSRAGEVWLSTGEGATPTGLSFQPWLERFQTEGDQWWCPRVEHWGPSPNIWFAAHPSKQLYVSKEPPPPVIAQSNPLCFDCVNFFSRAAAHAQRPLAVSTPDHLWSFAADGSVTSTIRNDVS